MVGSQRCNFSKQIDSPISNKTFGCAVVSGIQTGEESRKATTLGRTSIEKAFPWAFFNGVSQGEPPLVGSGGVIFLSKESKIEIRFARGQCSNNKVELVALWVVLKVVLSLGIAKLQLFGDSQIVIGWENHNIKIRAPHCNIFS